MSTLNELNTKLAKKEALLEKAYLALDSSLEAGDVKSYRFDSGEGSQRTELRTFTEIQDMIRC